MLLKITLTLCRGTAKDTCILRSPTDAFRNIYRPQRSWGKVMFLQASVVLLTGGACVAAGGRGACMVARDMRGCRGGVHGCGGECVVVGGMRGCRGWGGMCSCQGHAWLPGGVHGCWEEGDMHGCWGACVVARGMHGYQEGVCGCGGHAWLQGACVVTGGHAW